MKTALDNLNEDEIAALLEEVENQDALDSKGRSFHTIDVNVDAYAVKRRCGSFRISAA